MLWLKGAAVLAVITSIYFGYSFITGVIEKNALLGVTINTLETAITLKEQENTVLNGALSSLAEQNAKLQLLFIAAEEKEKRANKVLIEHDLDKLLQRKPKLIIKRVQAGTDRVFKEMEAAFNE